MAPAFLLSLLVLPGLIVAQKPNSLVTIARQMGGQAENGLDIDLAFTPLDTIVSDSQIIVRGQVRSVSTRLSSDEQYVLTLYEITATHFFKGSLPHNERPGPSMGLTVIQHGGTLDLDGLHLKTSMSIYQAQDFLRQGEDVILCLSQDKLEQGTFHIEGGPFGAFRIRDGMVLHMTEEVRKRNQPQPLKVFEQHLDDLASRR